MAAPLYSSHLKASGHPYSRRSRCAVCGQSVTRITVMGKTVLVEGQQGELAAGEETAWSNTLIPSPCGGMIYVSALCS